MAAPRRPVLDTDELSTPFPTQDPFLFAVYHRDLYPADKNGLGRPPGRGNGQDFAPGEYRFYHGLTVPGFPQHPHRGFETLTAVMGGLPGIPEGAPGAGNSAFVDHADGTGAQGRYGGLEASGAASTDLQWMTAGRGTLHSEMFPSVHRTTPNTLKLFQLWLNLPKATKFADPGYAMHWSEDRLKIPGEGGAMVWVFTGSWGGVSAPAPPPAASWAADPAHDVGVFHIVIPPGGSVTLPPAVQGRGVNRSLYVFEGTAVVAGTPRTHIALHLAAEAAVPLSVPADAATPAELLVLQGTPIGEPVVQRGPFVLNTQAELQATIREYQATQFGGWTHPSDGPVWKGEGRFATMLVEGKMAREERPTMIR